MRFCCVLFFLIENGVTIAFPHHPQSLCLLVMTLFSVAHGNLKKIK